MQSFFSTLTQVSRRNVCRRQWVSLSHTRFLSDASEAHYGATSAGDASKRLARDPNPTASAGRPASPRVDFENLGLHPPIVASLRAAFPDVKYPTDVQSEFIPAILGGKDVLLKDATGSGKSFGLVLALLNKPRLVSRDAHKNNETQRHITSLVLVPHRELAFQLLHWIERMVNAGEQAPPLSMIAQVLVRDDKMHLGQGLETLRAETPHVLIGTPQAILDVYQHEPELLQLRSLSSVVVDEVDYLIETVSRKDPNKSFKRATEKAKRKLLTHPGPTRQLLDVIYDSRKEVNEKRIDEPGMEIAKRRSGLSSANSMPPSPQLVLSSATLRTHLKNFVYDESGWLDKDNVAKVSGRATKAVEGERVRGPEKEAVNASIQHSVLLVSDERVRNIPGAVTVESLPSVPPGGEEVTSDETGAGESTNEVDADLIQKYSTTPSVFTPCMMETVAAAFAMDVPSIALLVLPSSTPVKRAVWELRELGVNAHGLDLQDGKKGRSYLASGGGATSANPVLLVSTLATTRGLDLPALSHVFLYGMPEGPRVNSRTVDAYLHIAGRVGRFGRGGKVVTLVEDRASEIESESEEAEGAGAKMARILKTIGVGPVQFAAFE
ncbi:hypothetical protein D9611_005800 [Ephemerocybe angulata]|uniref:RNA helicase n=1 Tax=Ephemerocybe angulata TaxID=980116 RepID=A0A8H5F4K0_9AGAR|nr:hypothetical protein D9611_005800 [Tulosesus angulatus]